MKLGVKIVVAMAVVILGLAFGEAQSQEYFGAIAYSKSTGICGVSVDHRTIEEAVEAAVRSCGSRDCESLVSFSNTCGALAVGDNDKHIFSWSWGAKTRWIAEADARSRCEQEGGGNCISICYACTRR